jgi:elongation factor Ts
MLEREKAIFRAKLAEQGKPEAMWDKIMVGQVKKFYSEVVLVHQAFVKDPDKSIADVLKAAQADCGAVEIKSFTRFQLGEELPGEESASEE